MFGGVIKTSSRLAILAAAGIFISGYGPGTASAADLGGDCCADLEERVAELEATTVRKGKRQLSMTLSGRVNMAVYYYDADGDDIPGDQDASDFHVIGGPGGGNKVSIDGRAQINSSLEALYRISFDFLPLPRAGGKNLAGLQTEDSKSTDSVAAQEVYWGLRHSQLGAITVGIRGQAYNGAAKVDVSGAAFAGSIDPNTFAGGMSPTFANGGFSPAGGSGFQWNNLFQIGDGDNGGTEEPGVRYDSPVIAGFILSADWTERGASGGAGSNVDSYSVRLSYANQFGDFKVVGAAGYFTEDDEDPADAEVSGWLGSLGVMHIPTGLFVNFGGAETDFDDGTSDPSMWYVTAGIQQSWFGIGKTTIYGQYYASDDNNCAASVADGCVQGANADGFEANFWGIGLNQKIDAASMDLYIVYRNHETDYVSEGDPADTVNDLTTITAGARILF